MNKKVIPATPAQTAILESSVLLHSEPQPLEIDLQRTAVIVVDMQNAFVSEGGMFDLTGTDIAPAQEIIEPVKRITSIARAKGCKVIYTVSQVLPDWCDRGGQNSPTRYGTVFRIYHEHPEWRDRLPIGGTWGADIVKELEPQEGDIVVAKPRYSIFFGTRLDIILKTCDIKYLVFIGTTINVCVETSIRDAFNLEYFSILVSDSCAHSGPSFVKEATIFNVKRCFGWVTTTENTIKAMK